MAETPSWAIYGAEEEGFDPIDARYIHTLTITLYTKLLVTLYTIINVSFHQKQQLFTNDYKLVLY
jgi:ABC-type transporter Mla maintaining outer membrane lipid asymmetry ATPase subunit MlaF